MAKHTVEKIRKLQEKYGTDAAIGMALGGISRQAVHQIRKNFGLKAIYAKRANISAAKIKSIIADYKAGINVADLALKHKFSRSFIYKTIGESNFVNKKAVAKSYKRTTSTASASKKSFVVKGSSAAQMKRHLISENRAGVSVADLSKKYKLSQYYLYKIIRASKSTKKL